MQIKGPAQKVTIYIGESDKWGHKPLHTAILQKLKDEDCGGATVFRALTGFGAHSRIRSASLVALSSDLPLIIEWIDNPRRIQRVLPQIQTMVSEGLITLEVIEVVAYGHRALRQVPGSVPVQDVMSREVQSVNVTKPLLDVVELLLDKVYKALPVVDDAQRVVGIVTEGDIHKKIELLSLSAQHELTSDEMAAELHRLRRIDQTVAQIMTHDPITVTGDMPIAQAIELMLKYGIKRLPVVDEAQKLQGIISRVDVLRAFSQPPVDQPVRPSPTPGVHNQVRDIMVMNVPTVLTDAPLVEIVELMVTSLQRRVVVIDQAQHVVGIITDGDLIRQATATERSDVIQALTHQLPVKKADSFHLRQRTAAEIMTTPVMTVTLDTSLRDALRLLVEHSIKRLPVVDDQGQLAGLVGRGGILQAIGRTAGLGLSA
ncbi:MAG TPA: DUF190 domain-containing protein [Anaerolineae bacterium]|nr:DUF190 domain-containing protein [Anaerolineae bacterium]